MSEIMSSDKPDRERDEAGRYTATYTADDFISAVSNSDLPSTSEVGEIVGCKYRTAYDWLTRLEDEGQIESREIGNSLVWMIPGEDRN